MRADEQLREQHAFDAVVLGVLRLAGDLRDEIGRRVVLADQLGVVSHSRVPHVLGALHQRGENLVVVLAAAQIAGDAVRQFLARRVRVGLQVAGGGHDEAGHAERALEALLVDDALLHRRSACRWRDRRALRSSATFLPRVVCVSTEHE